MIDELERVCAEVGYPASIRVDQDSEFISRELDPWPCRKGLTLNFSSPGKPTDNAFIESLNGKFRADCLNQHWFMSLDGAIRKCEAWRRDYNEVRPHSAIGNKPPITPMLASAAQGPPLCRCAGKTPAGRSRNGVQLTSGSALVIAGGKLGITSLAIEIELRALLSLVGPEDLLQQLRLKYPSHVQWRWFVDVSKPVGNVSEREVDVRLRVTNGSPELAVKRGRFGSPTREEVIVPLVNEGIGSALSALNLLGYSEGTYGARRIERFRCGAVEVSVHEVLLASDPSQVASRFAEFEAIEFVEAEDEVVAKIGRFMGAFDLSPMSAQEWSEYAETINEKWDGEYIFGETELKRLTNLGDKN